MPDQRPPEPNRVCDDLSRYSRQILLEKIGEQGQRRLLGSRVLLVGCGALGTVLAETLVRAGVGCVRICDRDFVETSNLQRQVLFDETDVAANLPKAEAAAAKLRRINSQVTVLADVVDVNHTNIERLADGVDLLLDGTDNFETRYLINDLAVQSRRPWVYGAAVGMTGLCMPIIPHDTPCLRCVFEEAPPPEANPTCDTAGVLSMTVGLVANLQAVEAVKILTGRLDDLTRRLMSIDAWTGRVIQLNVQSTYDDGNCPCCKRGRFDYLSGRLVCSAATLCGRNAVQINMPEQTQSIDIEKMAAKLAPISSAPIKRNAFLLKVVLDGCEVTLFADGRAIVQGTDNPDRARTLYAKYLGS